jgi:hypothetical protein
MRLFYVLVILLLTSYANTFSQTNPNARTNITALTDMTALMAEYKHRGLELPTNRAGSQPATDKKWWQFWK